MRFYGFGNYYLSSIQQGIQNLHVLGEMVSLYQHNSTEFKILVDWATHEKTAVLLNGGNSADILETFNLFKTLHQEHHMALPFALFKEDKQSLGNAPTACGIIVPKHIYEFAALIRHNRNEQEKNTIAQHLKLKHWEFVLANKLNQFGLAS